MQPPKKALMFLRWFCRKDYVEEIEGDLTEIFRKEYQRTPRLAKWKFAWNVIGYLRPEFMNFLEGNPFAMKTILNLKENPFNLLLFAGVALLISTGLSAIVNLGLEDKTMFAVPLAVMLWVIPLLVLCSWLLYLITRRFLYSMTVTWIHVIVTVTAIILIVVVMFVGIVSNHPTSDSQAELIGRTMQFLFLSFVTGQVVYIVNVLLGLYKKHA